MAIPTSTPDNYGKPISYDPNFDGPLKKRSCTDIICLILFVVFIACWVAVGIFAYTQGDPETLLKPRDSNGSRCGLDAHVKHKPYLLFFDLTKCIGPSVPFTGCKTPQICVEACPTTTFVFFPGAPFNPNDKWYCLEGVKKPVNSNEAQKLIEEKKCAPWYLESTQILNRCIPKGLSADAGLNITTSQLEDAVNNVKILGYAEKIGHDVVEDIKASWKEILGGVLLGILLCVIYIAMMRWIAAAMVWISIIGVIAFLGAGVYFTAMNYSYYKEHPTEYEDATAFLDSYIKRQETWLVLLIILSVVLVIFLLVLIFLRKRISLAVALIEEGSKAVSAATSSLVFPIVPWVLQIGVIIYAIAVALYLSSTGNPYYKIRNMDLLNCQCEGDASAYKNDVECDPDLFDKFCTPKECKNSCQFVRMNNPPIVPYLHAFNIVGFFWGVCFMTAFGEMVLAATFATWYWTRPRRKIPFFTVTSAVLRTLRYHIGTLAFGSLIIAICKIIRVCLEYIDHKLKKYDNEITKAIMCCLKCFFWCLEKFLKFLNKNAYIMCAIHGRNFCLSAKDAFSLLMRNILRVFVLDKVTDFLFFLSKLLVTAGAAAIIWSIIYFSTKDNYTYYYVPVIFVAICIYLISSMFFNVYSMAVDTLFMCYLEDCERNDGTPEKPYFMSKNLGKIFGKRNKRE